MSNILVSVVMPCYNCEKTIIRALDSIKVNSQTGYEVICVDDCSKDNTKQLIEKYINESKKNIQYFRNDINLGAGETRNAAIAKAQGHYIVFLDSDDYFADGAVDKLLKLAQNDYDLIVFDASIVNKGTLPMYFTKSIKTGIVDQKKNFVFVRGCTCGKMYKRELILNNNIKFGNIKINEDLMFTKRASAVARSIFYVEDALYCYDMGNTQSLMHNHSNDNTDFEDIAFMAIKDFVDGMGLEKELNSLYFLEVLYGKTKNDLFSRKKYKIRKQEFKVRKMQYDCNNIYFKDYLRKYKIMYYFFNVLYR